MSLTRTEKISGPAIIKMGSNILYTEADIIAKTEVALTQNTTSFFGDTSPHTDTVKTVITAKPAPAVTAANLSFIYDAFKNVSVGTRLYGASPNDCIIWTKAGVQHTYKVAAVTGLPNLAFSAGMPLYDGDITITAIGDCSETPDTANHYAAWADVAFTDTSYDNSKEFQLVYAAAWGASPFDAIETMEGFKIAFDLQVNEDKNDSAGIYEMTVTGFGVTASFTPIGIEESDIVAAMGIQGTGAARGARRETFARDLTLTTDVEGDPYFTLYNCVLNGHTNQHGVTANNAGELSLVAHRKITSGAQTAMFDIGLTAAA